MTLTCSICGRVMVEDESSIDERNKYIECPCGAQGLNPFYVENDS